MKHSKECFIRYPNTSKLVKKNSAAPLFYDPLLSVWISDETLLLVFDILRHTDLKNQLLESFPFLSPFFLKEAVGLCLAHPSKRRLLNNCHKLEYKIAIVIII